MASSESQRIMNLSLTKIMSSRSRRGGVSLHRNLLVASVLFKARDVYAAEMAGLVVIRNGCVYEPSSVSDADPKAETQDISNENLLAADETPDITTAADENFSTDENLIRDEQIMEIVNAVVCPPSVPDSTQDQSGKLDSAGDTSSLNNKSDSELESCKENIEPSNSNQSTTDLIIVGKVVKPKRSRKQTTTKQFLKRKYTEVEQAVLSITTESETPKKLSRVVEEADADCGGKMDLTCNELSSSFPEWHSDRVCANHPLENHVNNPSATSQDYKSCMDISDDAYSSSDSDQSTYSELTTYQPSFHSFSTDYCTSSSSSSDAITFSLSHPMLVSV